MVKVTPLSPQVASPVFEKGATGTQNGRTQLVHIYPIVRWCEPQDQQANETSCMAHTLIFRTQITFFCTESIRLTGLSILRLEPAHDGIAINNSQYFEGGEVLSCICILKRAIQSWGTSRYSVHLERTMLLVPIRLQNTTEPINGQQ